MPTMTKPSATNSEENMPNCTNGGIVAKVHVEPNEDNAQKCMTRNVKAAAATIEVHEEADEAEE